MASQDPKRLKMSSPSDDDAPPPPSDPNRRRGKRRKIAIFLGYCGAGYQGMQKNPGARTIEAELELALEAAGAVPDADRGCPKRYDWARSARTDKGVSAAAQVVSGRFFVEPDGLIDRLNSALDPQIRIFGFKRATASFNAKKFCDRRRYIYLLPVFALDPSAHRDRESVAASLGSGSSELAKCLECSERGRKVPGLMGRQSRVPMEEERTTDLGAGMVVDGAVNSNPSTKSVIRVSMEEEQTDIGVDIAVDGAVHLNPTTESVTMVSMEEEKADIGVGMGDDGSVNLNPSMESVIRISMDNEQTDLGVDMAVDGAVNLNPTTESVTTVSMEEEKTDIGVGMGDDGSLNLNPSMESVIRISLEEEQTDLGVDDVGEGSAVSSKSTIRASMEEEKTNLGAGRGASMEEEKFDLDGALNSNLLTVSAMRVSNAVDKTVIGNGEPRAVGIDRCAVFPIGYLVEGTGISGEKVETEISSNDSHTGKTKVWKEEEGLTEIVTQESPFEEVKITVETCALEEDEKVEPKGPDCINGEQIDAESIKFYYGEKEKERFNGILKRYVGTHNFHNFTTRTKAEDPSAQRYIISFTANSVVTIDGIDFIKCEVVGQSFMLHQIRKMIGFAVAIMRNCTPESLMDTALRKDVNINVPTAPEVGLYLDECFFSSYNNKWRDTHEELSIESYAEQSEEFKMKYIYSHIASMEHKEGAVALWLHSLNLRNYPDFNYLESKGQSCNAENSQEADKSAK